MYTGKHYELKPEAVEQINVIQDMMLAREGLPLTKHIQNVVASEVRSATIIVTSAQLLDLDANPVLLLPQLTTRNQAYDITSVCSFIDFNTTPYTVNSTVIAINSNGYINYEDTSCTAFIGGQDTFYKWGFVSDLPVVSGAGGDVTLGLSGGTDLTDGDSPIIFYIQYRILTLT